MLSLTSKQSSSARLPTTRPSPPSDTVKRKRGKTQKQDAHFVMRLTEAGVFYRAMGPVSHRVAVEELDARGGYLLSMERYEVPADSKEQDFLGMADLAQLKAQELEKKERERLGLV